MKKVSLTDNAENKKNRYFAVYKAHIRIDSLSTIHESVESFSSPADPRSRRKQKQVSLTDNTENKKLE